MYPAKYLMLLRKNSPDITAGVNIQAINLAKVKIG